MIGCGALVTLGLILIIRWGDYDVRESRSPVTATEATPELRHVLKRYLWYVTLSVVAGMGSGILMAGAGGRLVMRLLAATSSEAAQGRVTEADEIVGRISADGTIGFIIFVGLVFGLAIGVFYVLIARWLPKGRLGGVVFGALLLVWFGSTLDPLRPDNPDFDIVGPGWVSVSTFSVLMVAHGMLVAAVTGRYSHMLPLWSNEFKAMATYAPLLLVVPVFPLAVPLVLGAPVAIVLSRIAALRSGLSSRRALLLGRFIGVAASVVALPVFLIAVVDIASRNS
jgi:hypothetical protein